MPCLYIVSTPIGNLEDITLRAIRILKEVDAIVCEDTRHTRTLLDHYEIKKPMYSFHERSSDKDLKFIVSLLESGKNLAYVTDAGTPGIADPGNKLVSRLCQGYGGQARIMEQGSRDRKQGIQNDVNELALTTNHYPLSAVNVVPIPGPSSLAAAISVCGFNMQEFRFFGFLPHKKGRQTKIKEIVASEVPIVLFESKYRIQKLFEELVKFGIQNNRQIVVCNDLTKKFERVYRGTVEMVGKEIAASEPKGEFVVIIDSV